MRVPIWALSPHGPREVDDGYLINGMKTWVTDGPEASFYTVMCQTDPNKRLRGIGYFFVPRHFPGVSISPRFECLGTRTTPICEVAFKDVFVPKEYRLTPEGEGLNAFLKIIAEIRAMTAASGHWVAAGGHGRFHQVRQRTGSIRPNPSANSSSSRPKLPTWPPISRPRNC